MTIYGTGFSWALAPGDSDLEKAIFFAATEGNISSLLNILRDPNYNVTMTDRIWLAKYLNGELKNPRGRRPPHRRTYLATKTNAQNAALEYKLEMKERRSRGERTRGMKDILVTKHAREWNVEEETVRNIIDKRQSRSHGNKPTRK